MKLRITLLITILLTGCNNNAKQLNNNVKSFDSVKPKEKLLDSLNNPLSFYYLSDKPIEDNAMRILMDSISPSDNKITFDSMDSLSSANIKTRKLFFKVFIKILDKADGALAEAVGSYVIKYIESYPKEFLESTNKIDKKYFDSFANFAGYELGFLDDQGKSWLDSLNYHCLNCDSIEFKKFDHFKKVAQSSAKEINAN